jgi:hypothetical protein
MLPVERPLATTGSREERRLIRAAIALSSLGKSAFESDLEPRDYHMASGIGEAGRRARRAARAVRRARRRRVWAGVIGGVVGWGLAGLNGGEDGLVNVPHLDVDFAAAGTYTTPELGTVTFGLAANAMVVRQVMLVDDDRVEMVFDRLAQKVTVIRDRAIEVMPTGYGVVSLFEPFGEARQSADGPLAIVREGIGSHLGHACERYRAFGTVGGAPLRASACITPAGIPLLTEVSIADRTIRTQLTELDLVSPDPRRVDVPVDRDTETAAGG